MKWLEAIKFNGVAYRTKANGDISIKITGGRQWTLSYDRDGQAYFEELGPRYWSRADDMDDWDAINSKLTFYEVVMDRLAVLQAMNNAPIEKPLGLFAQLNHVTKMRDEMVEIVQSLTNKTFFDEDYVEELKRLDTVVRTMLEVL